MYNYCKAFCVDLNTQHSHKSIILKRIESWLRRAINVEALASDSMSTLICDTQRRTTYLCGVTYKDTCSCDEAMSLLTVHTYKLWCLCILCALGCSRKCCMIYIRVSIISSVKFFFFCWRPLEFSVFASFMAIPLNDLFPYIFLVFCIKQINIHTKIHNFSLYKKDLIDFFYKSILLKVIPQKMPC